MRASGNHETVVFFFIELRLTPQQVKAKIVGRGIYRITVNDEHTVENYVSASGPLLGAVFGATVKIGGRVLVRGADEAADVAAESVGGIRTAEGILYNGITGPGPLGSKVASTFRSGSYTEVITSETTSLYRVYGGKAGEIGPHWTRTRPSGPLQSVIDSAIDPAWGNNATGVVRIDVPRGVTIYEGAAAPQRGLVGGGNQVFVPRVDESWIVR